MMRTPRVIHQGAVPGLWLALAAGLAACGGTVDTQTVDPDSEWVRLASAEGGLTATVNPDGRTVVTTRDGTGVLWATLEAENKLAFAWQQQRYVYDHTGVDQTLDSDQPSGDLVVGGLITRHGQVGLPRYEKRPGSFVPHVLTIHQVNSSDKTVDFSVTPCESVLCDGVTGSNPVEAAFGETVVINALYQIKFHEDTRAPETNVIFSLIRRTDDTPVEVTEPEPEPEPEPGPEPEPPGSGRKHDSDDSKDWLIPVLGFAGVAAIAWACSDSVCFGSPDEE